MELIAEAYTIAEKSGIGQDLVYEYIKGTDGALVLPPPVDEETSVR
jgi:3-hydroxyisobutyrate dehydrogenase-like beta-hydroxyacid dehydrogenase